jgi:hypothetical protein
MKTLFIALWLAGSVTVAGTAYGDIPWEFGTARGHAQLVTPAGWEDRPPAAVSRSARGGTGWGIRRVFGHSRIRAAVRDRSVRFAPPLPP